MIDVFLCPCTLRAWHQGGHPGSTEGKNLPLFTLAVQFSLNESKLSSKASSSLLDPLTNPNQIWELLSLSPCYVFMLLQWQTLLVLQCTHVYTHTHTHTNTLRILPEGTRAPAIWWSPTAHQHAGDLHTSTHWCLTQFNETVSHFKDKESKVWSW